MLLYEILTPPHPTHASPHSLEFEHNRCRIYPQLGGSSRGGPRLVISQQFIATYNILFMLSFFKSPPFQLKLLLIVYPSSLLVVVQYLRLRSVRLLVHWRRNWVTMRMRRVRAMRMVEAAKRKRAWRQTPVST